MKDEFEAHPEKGKYKAEYERSLLANLEGYVKEADELGKREKSYITKEKGDTEEVTENTMPPSTRETYDALREDMEKMVAGAEDEAEGGNLEGSKFKLMLANELKEKIK